MSAPINVLAVMDSVIAGEREWGAHEAANALTNARAAVAELIDAAKHGREWIVEVGDRKGLPNGGTLHRLDAALTRVGSAA
ncbi:hypothetical protein QSH46_013370 [Xanthomonas arboricola pv. juglandis]|uniref:hypothetical protein n=1 Tax=Xanthomonas arboricola TaxID=56448 RepID=UPI00063EBE82|nr:hypothetical protein [Xanthomonas arboricola]MDN0220793.1 hypothetical protein [Xanthomonas arboricola pv. juglandis]MDN0225054.1 hypothetical protein [Xanthomonas arboricola pv. juglandis]MDN0229268.1 hypothetical protein [Xanthomonas arboricola pv. juglandis]MDN0233702.1 hypothetical protein [Xanthomonas arboricola pv. juglandis]MDN0237962.1 hypothetical protein [Xanthomonas arboricola pv. juglandis]